MPLGTEILLHVPNDFAVEYDDGLFGHSIFAPYVSKVISSETGVPVHFLATRSSSLHSNATMFDWYLTENFRDWSFRTAPFARLPYLPNLFTNAFKSASFYARVCFKPVVVMRGANVVAQCCLCVGGSAEDAVSQMVREGARFDFAVYAAAFAMGLKERGVSSMNFP